MNELKTPIWFKVGMTFAVIIALSLLSGFIYVVYKLLLHFGVL